MLQMEVNIAGGRTSFEGKVDLSLGNTELEMLLGYHNRDADSSRKYHPRIQEKAGSARCGFGSHQSVCGLSYGKTRDHQGRVL